MRASRLVLLSLLAAILSPAMALAAPTQSTRVRSDMQFSLDCERPMQVRNYNARATFDGVLNGNGTASANLALNGLGLATTIHFDARLGRGALPAPGGSSQLRVLSAHAVRGTWSLPNNDLMIDINTSGSSCAVSVRMALKRGRSEYTMWNGRKFYYCSAVRVLQTNCSAQ